LHCQFVICVLFVLFQVFIDEVLSESFVLEFFGLAVEQFIRLLAVSDWVAQLQACGSVGAIINDCS
jgi:hypothetical protein